MKKDQLAPSKLSPEARESIMFNKFLKACIESTRSSLESSRFIFQIYVFNMWFCHNEWCPFQLRSGEGDGEYVCSASPLKLAATYWKTHMDRLLMMKDEERTYGTVHEDQDSVYDKIKQLINLFYRAVDAEKNDDQVCILYFILT